jgi:hypothetical protein
VLFFIAITINLNYWSSGDDGEANGKLLFMKNVDGGEITLLEKLIALVLGLVHTLIMFWMIALVLFYAYLKTKKLTAYQYKEQKSVKIN